MYMGKYDNIDTWQKDAEAYTTAVLQAKNDLTKVPVGLLQGRLQALDREDKSGSREERIKIEKDEINAAMTAITMLDVKHA